jgi:hypothetical protein
MLIQIRKGILKEILKMAKILGAGRRLAVGGPPQPVDGIGK